jgi:AcrR family transcriptional regulator
MRTRARAGSATRDRVLDATLDELATAGGEAITMQAVAQRADVAVRTVYNHFAGRDELLAAAFARHAEDTRAEIETLVVPDADPEEQLRHVVTGFYSRYERMGARLAALLTLRGFPELDHHIRTVRARRRQLLTGILQRAEHEGTLAIGAGTSLALAFTLTSHAGWETLRASLDDDPGRTVDAAHQSLASALFHH